jgi:AcrR family transcriptional regulator
MIERQTRSWAGTTLADRRVERRQRFLDVGLDLLGTQGSAAVTVRSVCRLAALTDRYFYENFADREALLLAVYDEVADEAGRVLVETVTAVGSSDYETVARAAVDAFLGLLTDDPRKGRVLLLEPLTDATLGIRGVALSPAFAEIIQGQLGEAVTPADAQLTATALVGALANLFIRWLDGTLPVDRSVLSDYCTRLLVASRALVEVEPVSQKPASGR